MVLVLGNSPFPTYQSLRMTRRFYLRQLTQRDASYDSWAKWGTQQGVDIPHELRNPAASGPAMAMMVRSWACRTTPSWGSIAQPILALIPGEMQSEMKDKEPPKQTGRFVQNNKSVSFSKATNPVDEVFVQSAESPCGGERCLSCL